MKRYIRCAETIIDTSYYGGEDYAYMTYDSATDTYRVYETDTDKLLKSTSDKQAAEVFYERYISNYEDIDPKNRRVIDYTDWDSIYDYYYNLAMSDGDGEEYAHEYAKRQADMQLVKR